MRQRAFIGEQIRRGDAEFPSIRIRKFSGVHADGRAKPERLHEPFENGDFGAPLGRPSSVTAPGRVGSDLFFEGI